MVGKVRLALTPWENHGWHVPLYVSARGLITGLIPARKRALTIEFDLVSGALLVRASDGAVATVTLGPGPVAGFHRDVMNALGGIGIDPVISTMPVEIPDGVAFENDLLPRGFDLDVARTYWRALVQVHRVFQIFRTRLWENVVPSTCSGARSTWP